MRNLGPLFADAWRLFKPYFFRSEQRWAACGLLAVIIGLNVVQTELGVLLSFWRNHWYNSLQEKNWDAFISLTFTWYKLDSGWIMPGFVALATVLVLMGIVTLYLTQLLQIRWRAWMTGDFLQRWLSDRAYYRISVTSDPSGTATDNPDQRISDDMAQFCGAGANARPSEDTLSIGLDLLTNIVSLFSFLIVLWSLSGSLTLFGVTIPGFLVWLALVYALIGTGITHLVGRRLIPLRFAQQRLEANFRFGLVRVRENTEGIALYDGQREERAVLNGRFDQIRINFLSLLRRTCGLNFVTGGYNQASVVFPFIVASPRYFAGLIPLGTLIQISESFGQVQGSLSWVVNNYPILATWRAAVARLATFDRAIEAARAAERQGVQIGASSTGAISLDDVALSLPDGTRLLDHEHLELARGQATIISGRSGTGKSTLFRALAGIWPFGTGTITRPPGTYLFLPQKPYIPLGTLRHAVAYPASADSFDETRIDAALHDSGLERLLPELDADENWSQRLSGGEQQRLAIARALLNRPDWLFLDEATSSLDPEAEDTLYTALRNQLTNTTIISIAHRPNVVGYHDRHLKFSRVAGSAGHLAMVP